jgi:integrase
MRSFNYNKTPSCGFSKVITGTVAKIQYAKNISAHSLRRRFATEASRLGASMPTIQKHGRWQKCLSILRQEGSLRIQQVMFFYKALLV